MRKPLGVCGREAYMKNRRLRVLRLVSFRRLAINESKLLDNYPTLTATDLANAWAYAAAFSHEIKIDTRENDED
ncbi:MULTISPECIES: DUF433 domain-containing protein [unclassified Microcoleus]|uniref:DUF433 domain-containing protein n=1 Tax=unclassified Microcoleus TaxID=2642155 RepID=UPI002FD03575